MKEYLDFAKKVALQAGNIMLDYFDTEIEKKYKSDKQLVTIADEQINQMVIDEVEKAYPDHSIFGEESSLDKKSAYVWVCDPIDGTIPFSLGIPVAVFSLALVKDGDPIIGVVYDPFMKRLYYAALGQGAYVNEQPMRVSSKRLDRHSVINVEWWVDADYDIGAQMRKLSLATKTYSVCISSVANASCLVANGKYEASVFGGGRGKNVDIAAVKIIVEEAGGRATDLFGENQRYDQDIKGAVISNGIVHDDVVAYLNNKI